MQAAVVNRNSGWTNKCPKWWLETRRNTARNTAYPGKPAVYTAHHFKIHSHVWHKAGYEQSSSNKWLEASSQEAATAMQLFQHHNLSHWALHPSQLVRTPKGYPTQRWHCQPGREMGTYPWAMTRHTGTVAPAPLQICLTTPQIPHHYPKKKKNETNPASSLAFSTLLVTNSLVFLQACIVMVQCLWHKSKISKKMSAF